MTDPFERRVTELLERLADHAPTDAPTSIDAVSLAPARRSAGGRGLVMVAVALAAVVLGAIVWVARPDDSTDVSTTDPAETVAGTPTTPTSSTGAAATTDISAFCSLALSLTAAAMPESYVGSAAHLADIESMQRIAPAELAPEFATYATFIAGGAVDPADPESSSTENWPPGVQQAIGRITTYLSSNCEGISPFLGEPIGVDDQGDAVAGLQQRLTDLGFVPGPVDGYFGQATEQAVWAFQKLVLQVQPDQVGSEVGAGLWNAMQADPQIEPRRPGSGVHVEIDLVRQVLSVFDGDTAVLITHMSSGDGQPWLEQVEIEPAATDAVPADTVVEIVTGIGVTPGGVYRIADEYSTGDGWTTTTLGRMYRPIFFDDGIAIYGAADVPNRPSSRGGVEVPMHVIERLHDLVEVGDPVYVFDGVQEPEFYGAGGPPPFEEGPTG